MWLVVLGVTMIIYYSDTDDKKEINWNKVCEKYSQASDKIKQKHKSLGVKCNAMN